jgi:osmotically-inducible protein OsmY
MTIGTLLQADLTTRDAVLRQLAWDSAVDASEIGVTARDAVVTLTGFVDSYAMKLAAERAAKRIHGVRAVANDLVVRLRIERSDAELAADAARALELHVGVPPAVQAIVHSGHLTLTGKVPTLYHKAAAYRAVSHLRGIKGIANHIEAQHTSTSRDVHREITAALHRDATLAGHRIDVHIDGQTATLTGEVPWWHAREAAEHAAMHAPGITAVDNKITVAWPRFSFDDDATA